MDDLVTQQWLVKYGIHIPRAEGIFESPLAWIRITHGVITAAGLKNQSILSLAISLELLDRGAEHHGNLYTDWRAAFHSRLDPTTSGGTGIGNLDAWSKEDRYHKLINRVERDYLLAMDSIVAMRPKAKHLAAFQINQAVFIHAFNVVAQAMVEINKEADQALEAANKACA